VFKEKLLVVGVVGLTGRVKVCEKEKELEREREKEYVCVGCKLSITM